MTTTDLPDMYVLDALASDLESLDDILRVLNSDAELGWRREWGREFQRTDVVQALARLIQADSVRVYLPNAATRGLIECSPRSLHQLTLMMHGSGSPSGAG